MIDGVVGKVLVSPRSVVRRGEPMIEIAGASLPGKIAKVSVIADALPKEFQKAIRAHRRNTMARNEPTRPCGRILAGGGGLGAPNHWIAAGNV